LFNTTDLMKDPYGTLAAVRECGPAFAIENGGHRMWAITRYADVRRVLSDPTVLRDVVAHRCGINARCLVSTQRRAHLPHSSRRSFFDRDGDNHHRLRAMVGDAFTPARRAERRTRVEQLVARLVSGRAAPGAPTRRWPLCPDVPCRGKALLRKALTAAEPISSAAPPSASATGG